MCSFLGLTLQGYATGNPDNRMRGSLLYAGLFTLIGIVGKWAVQAFLK